MAQLIKAELFQITKCSPLMQFQRYRGKINIQRPQKPHYQRALVSAVTRPDYPQPPGNISCFQKRIHNVVENPYNDIIAREVRNWIDHSKMIGIFHLNSINSDDFFDARVKLHKQNMQLKRYGAKIFRKAIGGSQYQSILPLFESENCIVFSPEQKVVQLLNITRKIPQMLLLGCIVDNTLLSRNEVINYAQLGNLQSVQAELVHTLNTAASALVQNLEAHQTNFVNVLDVYSKGELPENEENDQLNMEKKENNNE